MKLTNIDYESIANQIEVGKGIIEYEKDGETLYIDYEYEEDGYVEDDYYNGTGAFVVTGRSLNIMFESFNEDGEETENDFDQNEVLKLMAA